MFQPKQGKELSILLGTSLLRIMEKRMQDWLLDSPSALTNQPQDHSATENL